MERIPNNFHFVFGLRPQTEPFHLMYYLCLSSCIGVNKPDKIFFYYHYEPYGPYWDMIKPSLTLEHVELNQFIMNFRYPTDCGKGYSYAHQADFIRLEMLLERGGVYADMDTIFVNKLPDHFFEQQFIMGEELGLEVNGTYNGSLCNAWIMSAKGAEFGKKWLEKMSDGFDGSWSGHSTLLPYRMSKQYAELIHIEPETSFFKHRWTKEGIRKLFTNDDADLSDVYSFHLWSHLWWEKNRTDFSYFHQELLTEEYVMFAPTTYARVARSFLPTTSKPTQEEFLKQQRRAKVDYVFLFSKRAFRKIGIMGKEEVAA